MNKQGPFFLLYIVFILITFTFLIVLIEMMKYCIFISFVINLIYSKQKLFYHKNFKA
jgi:hypothetical protein